MPALIVLGLFMVIGIAQGTHLAKGDGIAFIWSVLILLELLPQQSIALV
jgi:hypothetical protein